jgi:hypothetical protein
MSSKAYIREILPDIDIAVGVPPSQFLERMASLGELSGLFNVERHCMSLGERKTDIVNFRSHTPNSHKGDGFQLIAYDDRPRRVGVEMRAKKWSPNPPNREVYVEAAQALAGTLLKQYNRSHGTRHRLRIVRRTRPTFLMTERTATLLHRFTVLANVRALHYYDWQRFYALIREGRQELPEHIFRLLLVEAGFPSDRAGQLAEIYAHLWAFKRIR